MTDTSEGLIASASLPEITTIATTSLHTSLITDHAQTGSTLYKIIIINHSYRDKPALIKHDDIVHSQINLLIEMHIHI